MMISRQIDFFRKYRIQCLKSEMPFGLIVLDNCLPLHSPTIFHMVHFTIHFTISMHFKHEYLRSRAYIGMFVTFITIIFGWHFLKIYALLWNHGLSSYSCLHLGSLHPRIFHCRIPFSHTRLFFLKLWLIGMYLALVKTLSWEHCVCPLCLRLDLD